MKHPMNCLRGIDRWAFNALSSSPLLVGIVALIGFGIISSLGILLFYEVLPAYIQWLSRALFGSAATGPMQWWYIPLLSFTFFIGITLLVALLQIPKFIRWIGSRLNR